MNKDVMNKEVNYVEVQHRVEEEVIVSNILQDKELAMKTFYLYAVRIGEQLTKAKAIIKHGEWTNWLKNRVQFSERTAQNYMKIYREGSESGRLNPQTFADLGYSQVIEILSLPGALQEDFLSQHEAKEMSARAVKEAVADYKVQNEELIAHVKAVEAQKGEIEAQQEMWLKEVEELTDTVKRFEAEKAAAAENMDKELEKRLESAIKATDQKLVTAEKKQIELQEKLVKLESSHKEEIARLKEKAEKDKEALSVRKDQTLEKKTEAWNKKLDALQEKLDVARKGKENAEAQAKLNENIVRCKVLLNSIQDDCKAVMKLFATLEKDNIAVAKELRMVFQESLSAYIERVSVKAVQKAS